jgi:tetratricopeptide (TPR) repeat protein
VVVVGSSLAGRFAVERLVSHGSMTTVYRALDRDTGRHCAIKLLATAAGEFRHRFLREATVLSRLRHPAIVGYVGHGLDPDGLPYLAMEWLEGEDLDRRLAREKLSLPDAVALGRRVADALIYAHAAGVIHRDIKPGNIVLAGGDPRRATVVDFGLARFVMAQGLTRTGLTMGTPGYMAPEQARGARDLDERVDLYSLGCVLFHCIAGVPPYAGEHVIAVLARLLLDEPPSLAAMCPEVPPELDDLVGRLMAKDADRRPRSATEVLAALDAVGSGPRAAPRPTAFTGGERRLLSLILIAPDEPHSAGAETEIQVATPRVAVAGTVARFGGTCEGLADGTVLALLPGVGTAADAAVRAARCALALRRHLPRGHIALATGWAEVVGRRRVVAEVLDRAMAVLAAGRVAVDETPVVRVDDVTAGLLDTGFRLDRDDLGLILDEERDSVEAAASRSHFLGREVELRQTLAPLREAVARQRSRAVIVSGPPGIGKSRLRVEAVRRLASSHPDLQVWVAHGDPVHAGEPFALAGQLVRRAASLDASDPPPVVWRKLSSRIARRVAPAEVERIHGYLAELTGSAGLAHNPAVAAMRRDPSALAEQKRRAWEDWLVAEAQTGPLLLVIEDLQWGDLPSLQLLGAALRRLDGCPLAVLATARPEIHDQVPGLWGERLPVEIVLGALPDAAAQQLAHARLPGDVSASAVAEILECAEGNPLFLEELCRAVRDRATSTAVPARRGSPTLPPTLVAVIEARLEALGAAQRSVLRAASIFGPRFWRDGVVALLGDAAVADDALATLVERDLIRRVGGAYNFRHPTVLEVAYASLTEEDRRLGHAVAGQWLVAAGESDAIALAEHFDRGGEPSRAIEWYLRAAEASLAACELATAARRAVRGAACGAAGATRGHLRRIEAEAELWRGRYRDAEAAAREARRQLAPWSREWVDASGVLAMAAGHLDRSGALGDLADELLESTPPAAVASEAAAVAARVATYLILADTPTAMPLARRLIDGTASSAELPVLARAWRDLADGLWAGAVGDVGTHHARVAAAARGCETVGDRRHIALLRHHLGHAALELGDYPGAEAAFSAALELATAHDLHAVAAPARPELARALLRQGKLDEAEDEARAALTVLADQHDRRTEILAHLALAEIHLRAGQLIAAQGEAEIAVTLAADVAPRHAAALALLAEIQLAGGDADDALAVTGQSIALLDAHGSAEAEAHIRLIRARALARAGRVADARTEVTRARRRVHERAARISDPALRQSFLRGIAIHHRLLTWEP